MNSLNFELQLKDTESAIKNELIDLVARDVVVITTAQLHSIKPELRICTGSNPACGVLEIDGGEDL